MANARSDGGTSSCLRVPSPVATWTGGTNLTILPAAPAEHIPTPEGAMPGVKYSSRPTSVYYVFNFICNVISTMFI
jgi:hypothetical protein